MLTLKQFLYSVPICSPPITYQQLQILFQCNEQDHDSVVVVNAQRIPLGIIFSRDFLLSLLNQSLVTSPPLLEEISSLKHSPSLIDRWDWETCMSPLTLIPCDLNVFDLVNLLNADQKVPKQPNYGLVDQRGQFLGLLDSWKILEAVLVENSHPQPELGPLKNLIIELLEELPLPVMLQTHEGEIIQKNRIWREQIGEFIPPDQATACPLPQKTRDGPPQAISLDNIYNYCQTIAYNSIS